jgi:hypothetical protein
MSCSSALLGVFCLQDSGSVALLEQGLALMGKLTRLAGKLLTLL